MTTDIRLTAALCGAIQEVKRLALDPATLDPTLYLGGDLGIDSIEMLEIWFHAERSLGLNLGDAAKRDVYTIGEALAALARQQEVSRV